MMACARFVFVLTASLVLLPASPGRAQTEAIPSYAFTVQVVDTGACERPRINNAGEIVYTKRMGDEYRVFSNIRGQISAGPLDRDPDINDGGEIIWRFGDGGQGANGIGSNVRGTLYSSSGQDPYYGSHRINGSGEVVWASGGGRVYSLTRGYLSSPPTGSDHDLALNNAGEVVYRAYRWVSPIFSIQSTVQGVLASADSSNLRYPEINDAGEVVWVDGSNVCSSTRGIIRSATNLDSYVAINNHGDVVWAEDRQVYSSARGKLTSDPVFKSRPDINDRGDVVWNNADGSIGLASWIPLAPVALPPREMGLKTFMARWAWVEEGAPEGELSVASDAAFTQLVPGYEARYVVNSAECLVTNLFRNADYWYRVRRLVPDGGHSPWSSRMKVRTGKGLPVFKNLLGGGPVARRITQEFALSNLVAGAGTLAVKSSNSDAVRASVSSGVLSLQYLWSATNTAKVTLTLTHPATGYKAAYGVTLSQATGSVFVAGLSALTNAGARAAQEVTLENRTGDMVYGARVQVKGLDDPAWLINQTGLDPVGSAPILEVPCVLPVGSQVVVRLVYHKAYKTQAATRPVKYTAWAIMTPAQDVMPATGQMAVGRQTLYDGLWLLDLPAIPNRLYTVYHSDDAGENWVLDPPVLRATASYLMWLDVDDEAPADRLYRVLDSGM